MGNESQVTDQANVVIAEILQRALEGVDATAAFAQQEMPGVVQELLAWHLIESTFWAGVCLAVILIGLAWMPRQFKKVRGGSGEIRPTLVFDEDGMVHPGCMVAAFISFMCGVVAPIEFALHAMDAAKIFFAPKLYLLEYGAQLVN